MARIPYGETAGPMAVLAAGIDRLHAAGGALPPAGRRGARLVRRPARCWARCSPR
ncbi:hypothetical protein [Brachybacterium sp. GPGPB12]|uniref:hypothetical protein n=1 Tax=Brachybacterium sp. GPGPB12 TaxID=3023517 RepID=UPI0031342922